MTTKKAEEKKYKKELFRSKESEDSENLPKIKGYDFNRPFNFNEFLKSYKTTGFQATNMSTAIEIIKKMHEEKVTIFLAYNSNMVSCGLREIIAWLVKNKLVHVLATTAGGVEEDVIKTLKPFLLGKYEADGAILREKCINRIGNIYVPDKYYVEFEEKVMIPFLKELYERQKKENRIFSASDFIYELGKKVHDENSILYWATKNNIPIFCPALTDGSIGDMISFFKYENPGFKLDISDDIIKINEIAITSKKTGVIVLGGNFPKHHVCNANLFRGGADYAVYITLETEEGGADSGARIDEAKSWGKIKPEAKTVKVYGDATIIFPLIVAGAFLDNLD